MRLIAIMAALLFAAPVTAQETRTAPADHAAAAATLDDMNWLVGQWVGTGINDNPAMESWLPATGNVMVGTFVQAGDDGNVMFSEILYLTENEGSVELRLKHFTGDLISWEEREEMLTFRLVAMEECAAYFRGLTLRCDGEDGLLAAVRMSGGDGEVNELVFRFVRQ